MPKKTNSLLGIEKKFDDDAAVSCRRKTQTSWLRKQHFTFRFFFLFDFVYFLYNFFWLADRLTQCVCVSAFI